MSKRAVTCSDWKRFLNLLTRVPKGKKCAGMEGLVKEGSEVMEEDFEGALMDAALIGAAQRVEHYEIAAYGTASEFAKLLGESEHVTLLEETLQEEKETDEKLTELAKEINPQANEEAEESEEPKATPKRSRSAAKFNIVKEKSMSSPASIKKHPVHPILVGFPIGLWVFALVCDVVHAASGNAVWQTVADLLRCGRNRRRTPGRSAGLD